MSFGPFFFLALLEGLVSASVLALTAVGLSLVFGVMRVVNVAHGAFFMLGAVLAALVSSALGLPPYASFALALVVSPLLVGLLAAGVDRLVLARLNHDADATIVATIGLLYILEQAVLSLYGPDAQSVAPPFDLRLQLPWFGYSGYKLAVILAAALVLACVFAALGRSRAGLMMRATQIDAQTATAFGIDTSRVYMMVFGLGAALAALGGVLTVPIRQAHYLMGGDPLLLSFIVVIIGGLGSLRGTVVAALVIGVSEGVISMMFSPSLAKILATLLVALVLVFRPQGLFGKSAA